MQSPPPPGDSAAQLRADAEAELARLPPAELPLRSAEELWHELQLREIELRMQGERLRQAELALDAAAVRTANHALDESLALSALDDCEEIFRQLFDVTNDAFLVVDCSSGQIIEANPAAEVMYGYTRAELLGLAAENLSADRELTRVTIRSNEIRVLSNTHRRKDGSEFPVEIAVSHCMIGERRLRIGAVRDISERQRGERDLREKEAFSHAILDSMSSEIAVLDRAGVISAVNQSWLSFALENGVVCGQAAAHTGVGSNYLAFCVGDSDASAASAAAARAGIEAVLDGSLPHFDLEYPCHSPDKQRWFTMSVTPLKFDGQGAVVAHSDISDRKRAEQALQESERRYRTLVEWSPEGIRVHRDGIVLYVNPTAVRMFGANSADDLVGRSILDLVHPDDRQKFIERVRQTSENPDALQVSEENYLRLDGSVVNVAVHSALVVYDGKPAIHCSLRDISERKRVQSELSTLRSDMEQLLVWQVARHTAAALAHEVNQPLSTISALCEGTRLLLAAGGSGSATGSAAAGRAGRIEEAVQRMAFECQRAGGAVRDLLVSLRAPEFRLQAASLPALLQGVLKLVRACGSTDCQLLVDCPVKLPAVRINLRQVEKVLLNLITNSAEAMQRIGKPQGRVWISAAVSDDGSAARVSVRDEGPGISKAMEAQLFNPLLSSKPGNLGMGLAISSALIEAQGGRLWHAAQGAAGAVFHFTLPFAQ